MSDQTTATTGFFEDVKARGSVDYMLRTLQQNQIHMVTLADRKANIVLSLALVIVTLSAAKLGVSSFADQPILPLLLGGALIAALLAVVALLPKLKDPGVRADAKGGINLLFFGSIADCSADDYFERIAGVMETDGRVYQAITADVHATACVLKRKFRWLRYSYVALLITMIASALVALALQAMASVP